MFENGCNSDFMNILNFADFSPQKIPICLFRILLIFPHGDFMAHMPGGHHGVELVGHPHPRDLAPHHAVPFPPPPHPAPGMFGLSRV